ncbi:uncharacterized protein LOC130736547 [Lotus japonicus]|uniref:uncharacterized protein LOC130736547 n=1 Tax=Lotus japonicus TaxID=34305 RepID=UPI002588AB00|nr:uncharacterized protein LOC130736547 [Lotus japonicus]
MSPSITSLSESTSSDSDSSKSSPTSESSPKKKKLGETGSSTATGEGSITSAPAAPESARDSLVPDHHGEADTSPAVDISRPLDSTAGQQPPPTGRPLSPPPVQTAHDSPPPNSPRVGGEEERLSLDHPKDPSSSSSVNPFSFLLSHPYLEKLREVPSQNPLAQEVLSSLLRAGCLFAQVAWQARPLTGIAGLRQEVEKLHSINLQANETCSKLSAQLATEVDRTKKMQKKLAEATIAKATAAEKERRLENQVEGLRKDLSAKETAIASQEENLAAKDKEIADLRERLAAKGELLAEARSDLESKCKLLAEKDAQAIALEEQIRREAAFATTNKRIRGFLICKAQVKHLHPNVDLEPL